MPNKLKWGIETLPLELAYTWRISRNASDQKTNFLINVTDGTVSGRGEVAPNIRYAETPDSISAAFAQLQPGLPLEQISLTELSNWLNSRKLPNALDFGIRSAYTHFVSAKTHLPVTEMLGLKPVQPVPTSFSIPIMPPENLEAFLREHRADRFKWLKLKVNPENLVEVVREVSRLTSAPLLLDGNEAWQNPEELMRGLEQLAAFPVKLLEQPLPAGKITEYEYLKTVSPVPLLADESITRTGDFEQLKKQFHGINVKLMKAGGYFNAIRLLQKAKENGLFTMVGCMVESSLGISSAMNLASLADYTDLDGFMLLKKDPFGLVTEENGILKLAETSS